MVHAEEKERHDFLTGFGLGASRVTYLGPCARRGSSPTWWAASGRTSPTTRPPARTAGGRSCWPRADPDPACRTAIGRGRRG